MTIDEAIKHAEEVADGHDRIKQIKAVTLEECKRAYEHRQLAKWLKHYKKFRECMSMYYNGKIDKDKCFEMLTDMFTENGRRKEEE